ncbi:MAG TPA: alpha/beta fold hydrolase [Tepidisphaeraceae bacterium]|jgi:pimeloyl-ACP methyl ester carboxylesterase|nr:alpha/beta fold hydrolase [Tepidisphaeraceae bacterium]
MPTQSVNGTNLSYHEAGHGLPVVLVHGFPLDHRIWHAQTHDLAAVSRVITPDLRGFGHSADGGSFTIQSLADDLYVLLSQIHALPCMLGGLSMGGYVALAYARQYSSTLRGLMLIDTRAAADEPDARAGRDAMIELARTQGSSAVAEKMMPKMLAPGTAESHPHVAAELNSMMHACPAQTIQHALAAMRDRPDARPSLARIAAPTLILVGDSDVITPPAAAEEMHQAIRGSTLTVITGAGHMSPMEQPHQVSRAIKQFLVALSSK